MSIRFACQHCQATLNVADKFGGKRVKCPKCSQPIEVPAAAAGAGDDELRLAEPTPTSWGKPKSRFDDLLDEAGVKQAVEGPVCPSCGEGVDEGALICIHCGLNFETGEYLQTLASADLVRGQSEHEKLLRKAEKEIESAPISTEDQNFGDGPDSILIALGAFFSCAIIVAAIVGIIFLFDALASTQGMSVLITSIVVVILNVVSRIWITIVAFMEDITWGLVTILLGDCGVLVYALPRFGAIPIPVIMFLMSLVGTVIVVLVAAFGGGDGST